MKQVDSISLRLFTAVLEMIMSEAEWQNKGIRVDGRNLNNLNFADDIILLSNSLEEFVPRLVKSLTGSRP